MSFLNPGNRVGLVLVACVLVSGNSFAQVPIYSCGFPTVPGGPTAGDFDGDGVGNRCDCFLDDPGAFWIPREVGSLYVTSPSTLVWESLSPSPGPTLSYDVLRGDLADFVAGGLGTETCLAEDVAATTTEAGTDPPSGSIWFYLVRANNSCGGGPFADNQVHAACALPGPKHPPPAVMRVRGVANGPDYTLTWAAEPTASAYAIYRFGPGLASPPPYGACVAFQLTATTWTDVGVLSGASPIGVTYIVVAKNTDWESALGWDGLGRPRVVDLPCPW